MTIVINRAGETGFGNYSKGDIVLNLPSNQENLLLESGVAQRLDDQDDRLVMLASGVVIAPEEVAAAGLPAGVLLKSPSTGLLYGQTDNAGGYEALGGETVANTTVINNQQSLLGRALTGGMLTLVPPVWSPTPSPLPTVVSVPGVMPGYVVESVYCISAGSGALSLWDSDDGASADLGRRIFVSPNPPVAQTLYALPAPHLVRDMLLLKQSTLGSFLVCARHGNNADVPPYSNLSAVGVNASGNVLLGPCWLDSIQVVAPGSAGNLVLYAGTDTTFPQIVSIPYTSLSAGQVLRFSVGPSKLFGLRMAITTGGDFTVRYHL